MEQKHHFTGLTDKEVIESREKYGENVLHPPKRTHCGSSLSRNSPTPLSSYSLLPEQPQ